MTLREKLCDPFNGLLTETVDELERIAEEFAIGFAEWLLTTSHFIQMFDSKELLEIYKKEKKL
jgi:hypothetical protein